ncbi:MAG TPA: hypothetical protein VLB31_00535, partial [Actinomycetota bacterium]|nr:hypothetical protein [Actinomycetota bacterium]
TFEGGIGSEVCVMGGPADSGTATVDVLLDGDPQSPVEVDTSFPLHGRVACYGTDNATTHELVVTGASATTFWIDGFYVVTS